jgi:hypothetical protein
MVFVRSYKRKGRTVNSYNRSSGGKPTVQEYRPVIRASYDEDEEE